MLKYLIQLIIIYALLQYVFKVDLNSMIAPYLEPLTELVEDNDLTLEDLTKKMSDGNLSEFLENADLSQLQDMLNEQDLASMLEEHNLTSEDAQDKIDEIKLLLQEKLEEIKEQ
jgi:hypothetical protein